MTVESVCGGCGQKLRVADEYAGRQARCPQCGTIYTVPGDAQVRETQWWMKAPDGSEYGPVNRSELDRWFAEGRITAEARVKSTAEVNWQPAALVYPSLAAQSANPFSDATATDETNPYVTPQSSQSRYSRPHRGTNVLMLGVLSLVCCQLVGPVAWIMGHNDLAEIDRGDMEPSGRGLTQAGMILGIIATVMLILQSGVFGVASIFELID